MLKLTAGEREEVVRACCAVPTLSCLASRALAEALARSGGGWVEKREQLVRAVQHVGDAESVELLRLHYFMAALCGEKQVMCALLMYTFVYEYTRYI